ncbi:ATPase domain-containing protein [Thermoproteota archaeon]
MNKAKEQEKKFEWLQATNSYDEASDLALKEKDSFKAAELQERLGFCFIKAADQADTNKEFRKLMKQAVQAYRKELKILEEAAVKNKQIKITHAQALITYVEAVLEKNLLKKKKLLDEWWTLENHVISTQEKSGDLSFAGKVCNELLEYTRSHRYWLVLSHSEWKKNRKEYINLAEKAIQIFSQLDDDYELARAYFLATYYHSFGLGLGQPEDMKEQFHQKARKYSKKALELSHKIGDPYLIGESLRSKSWAVRRGPTLKDSTSAIEDYKQAIKYGKIAKSNYIITGGRVNAAFLLLNQALVLEDPVEQKDNLKSAIELIQKAKHLAEIAENIVYFWLVYRDYNRALNNLASIETDLKKKQELLELATKLNQEGMQRLEGWKMLSVFLLASMSESLRLISKTKSEIEEKRKLLQKSKHYIKNFLVVHKETLPMQYDVRARGYYQLAQVQNDLATIETDDNSKIKLLKHAVKSIEKAIGIAEKHTFILFSHKFLLTFGGMFYDFLGNLLVQINLLSKEENTLFKAIDSYEKATLDFEKAEMPTHIAETQWHIAQLKDELGEYRKASKNYELAAKAYDLSSRKISQLAEFYNNYSKYMLAWSQIEQAKYSHSIEQYTKAKEHYEKAAKLHESSEPWSYLTPNYFAWARVEEAESQSRKENTQNAKQTFQEAYEQFGKAQKSIKQKIEVITSVDEKEMALKLFDASALRRKFCQARILLEDAKLLDKEGKYVQSSKSYGEAAQNIDEIIEKLKSDAESKELKLITVLCRAWQKMAMAEEEASFNYYLEAAELFEEAKDLSPTKEARYWALGNSSFCKGLATKNKFQNTLDRSFYFMANKHVKQAADYYTRAGFQSASEYAKATQRLFDAYLYMNSAEDEIDPEKKTKYFQVAEQLLQIAAGSFMKAKQPEKTTEVQRILVTVREEKALATSLNAVMQAPTIASSTLSFASPNPTSEVSVGLEQFEHANIQANIITHVNEVKVGESFCLSVEFVNAGKEPALLTRVEEFIPPDFIVVKKPEIYRIEDTTLNMKGKQLAPLKLVEVKLTLQPLKKGIYQLNPRIHYLDELGQNKSLQLKSIEIKVEEVSHEGRMSTGTAELDCLLLGGIPEEYSVALTGPPSDEREMIIKNFLQVGIKEEQTIFYITSEPIGLENLLEKPNLYLFLCNPKPKTKVPNVPNIYRLRGKTDLTNLSIALTKAYRIIDQSRKKRVCVEIVSDVLLQFNANATRKWISELITDFSSKSFTMLAVMDPGMHPADQATAVINLFDGEISITHTKDPLECKKFIRVEKLRNQDYIKNSICLTNQK